MFFKDLSKRFKKYSSKKQWPKRVNVAHDWMFTCKTIVKPTTLFVYKVVYLPHGRKGREMSSFMAT
jgi:hypothetical protein